MNDRNAKLKTLFDVIQAIYVSRKDSHPDVAARFHVEGFVASHKNDKYFDQLLQEEIEDCSRAL
jgi:hypothetical protein